MAKNFRTLRTDLPNDVWDRLAEEAAAAGVPLGRFARNLFVARDAKRQAKQTTRTTTPNQP